MTASPRCLFRADAGPEIGLGHVARCLALAEACTLGGGAATLLSAGLAPTVAGWFEARGVELVALPPSIAPASAEDARRTREEAAARGAGALVVDGYRFEAAYFQALRAPGLVTAYVDDLLRRDLPVDVIINPNAGARAEDYGHLPDVSPVIRGEIFTGRRGGGEEREQREQGAEIGEQRSENSFLSRLPASPPPCDPSLLSSPLPVEVLAGARYTPLREEFRAARGARPAPAAPPLHLLVTFGGSDPAGMTLRAVRAAIAAGPDLFDRVTVLVGPLCPSAPALRGFGGAAPLAGAEPPSVEGFGGAAPLAGAEPPSVDRELAGRPLPRIDLRTAAPGEVAALFAGADVALGAAGSTSWELACLGVPMLLVEVADNQRAVIEPLAACGAAWALGTADRLTAEDLTRALRRIAAAGAPARLAMSEAGAALIDGEGARRVAAALAARAARGALR